MDQDHLERENSTNKSEQEDGSYVLMILLIQMLREGEKHTPHELEWAELYWTGKKRGGG